MPRFARLHVPGAVVHVIARFVNRDHKRFGPVFGDRVTTVLMPDAHLPSLVAYIHNNPVRAKLVSHPAETDWTSHRAWVGLDRAPPGLCVKTSFIRKTAAISQLAGQGGVSRASEASIDR